MARLCVCTCSPGAIADVAKPMTCPYLCTASPAAIGAVATLWPAGTCPDVRTCSPGSSVEGSRSTRATTTLSAALRRIVSGGIMVSLQGITTDPELTDRQFTDRSPPWQFHPGASGEVKEWPAG